MCSHRSGAPVFLVSSRLSCWNAMTEGSVNVNTQGPDSIFN